MLVQISVSGGRTSAYMAVWMQENRQAVAEHIGCSEADLTYVYTFANTGMEHDDTLRFMHDVDQKLLGGQVVWLEAVVHHGQRKSSTHRVVTFETAMRNTDWGDPEHPFTAGVMKYGIPNKTWLWCTREMKLNAMRSYIKTLGVQPAATAIGIRADEQRRVSARATRDRIIYPLVDLNPVDKEDVKDFWVDKEYDLQIPEWQGNCTICHKKSFKKLNKVWDETPHQFQFTDFIEREFGLVGPEFAKGVTTPRKFFREQRSTRDMVALFDIIETDAANYIDLDADGGCSESCEVYETEYSDE